MALAPVGRSSVNLGYLTFDNGAIDHNISAANVISLTNSAGAYSPFFAGAYTNASDAAFKTNIAPLTDGLELTLQLKPSSYEMIDGGQSTIGFIAQDVQKIAPQLVTTDNAGMLGLNYIGLIPVLTHAIQELTVRVVALEAQLAGKAGA